jgi:hypothetical protein
MQTRIRLFFNRRNRTFLLDKEKTCNEVELSHLKQLSHDIIEKEINYLTSDVPLECSLQSISSQPSKYQRLNMWHDILDTYLDACYQHEFISLPTRMYQSESTNRVMMKVVQLIFLSSLLLYIYYYTSVWMSLIGIIFILLFILTFYI